MSELRELVREELALPVDPRVSAMAQAIAAAHADASRAVLFYGSCLRQQQLDGLMLDFYLIVSDYRTAYGKRWLAAANRLIPPNVFYFEHGGLVAKYAVLSEADFKRECGPSAWNVSTVARFAQPSRLVWNADQAAADRVVDSITLAAPTLIEWTLPIAGTSGLRELWQQAFAHTFGAELRAERSDRASSLIDIDVERYERFGMAALERIAREVGIAPEAQVPVVRSRGVQQRWWRKMQRRGKWYSVARLAKASATFAGGADYIVWKINRHSGAGIELKPWQRRHPLLGALTLLPRLLKSGAVR
jgi:hypothetical protein